MEYQNIAVRESKNGRGVLASAAIAEFEAKAQRAREVPTPCFLLNTNSIRGAIDEFRRVLPQAGIWYPIKTNSHPEILRIVQSTGCGFEAASWLEIELLLSLGVAPSRILYGAPVKLREHVERAAEEGIDCFAADSREEIAMLAEAAPGCRVYIRGKVPDSKSLFRFNGKFGAPLSDVKSLLRCVAAACLVPWGVSFNVGSQALDAHAWADGIDLVAPIFCELLADGIELQFLNLGGGFPVTHTASPELDLAVIGRHITDALAKWPRRPQIGIEPGRRLVASSMRLVATVVRRVERSDRPWLFLDCGVHNALIEAAQHTGAYQHPVRREGTSPAAAKQIEFSLAGPTCDGADVIQWPALLPANTATGDRLVFENAGAYTSVLASAFNGFPVPPVLVSNAAPFKKRKGK